MKTTSTLAATTCSSVTCPAIRRENQLRRGKHGDDGAATLVRPLSDDDPVAHGRQLAATRGAMREAPGADRLDLSVLTPHAADVVELDEHTARLHIGLVRPTPETRDRGPRPTRATRASSRFRSPARTPVSGPADPLSPRRALHRGPLRGAGPSRRASDRLSGRCGDRPAAVIESSAGFSSCGRAKRVALTLHDEDGSRDGRQVLRRATGRAFRAGAADSRTRRCR